jgi:hypothetical protein
MNDKVLKQKMNNFSSKINEELDMLISSGCNSLCTKYLEKSNDLPEGEPRIAFTVTFATAVCKTLVDYAVMVGLTLLGPALTKDLLERAIKYTIPAMQQRFDIKEDTDIKTNTSIH